MGWRMRWWRLMRKRLCVINNKKPRSRRRTSSENSTQPRGGWWVRWLCVRREPGLRGIPPANSGKAVLKEQQEKRLVCVCQKNTAPLQTRNLCGDEGEQCESNTAAAAAHSSRGRASRAQQTFSGGGVVLWGVSSSRSRSSPAREHRTSAIVPLRKLQQPSPRTPLPLSALRLRTPGVLQAAGER